MGYALLRTSALALSFVAGIGLAAAQQQPPPADPQQQSNAVFVNGALAVPGAPPNTDTVPAKFSARNAADDKLITIAYTFKSLTDDERRAVYQALKDQPAGSGFNADIAGSAAAQEALERLVARGPPGGSGISAEAWRSWHRSVGEMPG